MDTLPIDLSGLGATHRIHADLQIRDGKLHGSIKIRPSRNVIVAGVSPTPVPGKPQQSRYEISRDHEETQQAQQALQSIGVDERTAKGLALQFGFDRIGTVTAWARTKNSPSGSAIQALRNGWNVAPKPTRLP